MEPMSWMKFSVYPKGSIQELVKYQPPCIAIYGMQLSLLRAKACMLDKKSIIMHIIQPVVTFTVYVVGTQMKNQVVKSNWTIDFIQESTAEKWLT